MGKINRVHLVVPHFMCLGRRNESLRVVCYKRLSRREASFITEVVVLDRTLSEMERPSFNRSSSDHFTERESLRS